MMCFGFVPVERLSRPQGGGGKEGGKKKRGKKATEGRFLASFAHSSLSTFVILLPSRRKGGKGGGRKRGGSRIFATGVLFPDKRRTLPTMPSFFSALSHELHIHWGGKKRKKRKGGKRGEGGDHLIKPRDEAAAIRRPLRKTKR